jgi:hypothetical protein
LAGSGCLNSTDRGEVGFLLRKIIKHLPKNALIGQFCPH